MALRANRVILDSRRDRDSASSWTMSFCSLSIEIKISEGIFSDARERLRPIRMEVPDESNGIVRCC